MNDDTPFSKLRKTTKAPTLKDTEMKHNLSLNTTNLCHSGVSPLQTSLYPLRRLVRVFDAGLQHVDGEFGVDFSCDPSAVLLVDALVGLKLRHKYSLFFLSLTRSALSTNVSFYFTKDFASVVVNFQGEILLCNFLNDS